MLAPDLFEQVGNLLVVGVVDLYRNASLRDGRPRQRFRRRCQAEDENRWYVTYRLSYRTWQP